MTQYRNLNYGDRLPETWLDAIQEYISTYASPNFVITSPTSTTVKVVAGTDNDQVAIGINGRWRYAVADVTAAHPGGGAATYDIYVTGSDNSFSGGEPETDSTTYAFGLAIRALASPPATALYRKVGQLVWDGASITSVTQTVGAPQLSAVTTDLTARNGAATQVKIGSISSAAGVALGVAGDVTLVRNATGPRLDVNVDVSATGIRIAGTPLAASHLSNGVTGTGAVVLAADGALTGNPTATTQAADNNSTRIATTAWYSGQKGTATPLMDGTGAAGSSSRWSPIDHVHPTDTSRAPLASPTFTGTPAAPTPSAGDSTTKIATTAFVAAAITAALPPGVMVDYGAAAAPAGWLLCDGAAVSRTTYAALFAVIGTLYGVGDGSTTFNLPDRRGRVGVGYAASGGHTDVSTLGLNDGVAVANRRPKHNHTNSVTATPVLTLPNHVHSAGTLTGTINDPATHDGSSVTGPAATAGGSADLQASGVTISGNTGNPTSLPAIPGTITIGGTIGPGGTAAVDAPAYIVVAPIIKT